MKQTLAPGDRILPAAHGRTILIYHRVVATAVGRVPEIVTPAVGRVVPPRDHSALGAASAELAGDPELRASMSAAARRQAFGWTLDDVLDAHQARTPMCGRPEVDDTRLYALEHCSIVSDHSVHLAVLGESGGFGGTDGPLVATATSSRSVRCRSAHRTTPSFCDTPACEPAGRRGVKVDAVGMSSPT